MLFSKCSFVAFVFLVSCCLAPTAGTVSITIVHDGMTPDKTGPDIRQALIAQLSKDFPPQ